MFGGTSSIGGSAGRRFLSRLIGGIAPPAKAHAESTALRERDENPHADRLTGLLNRAGLANEIALRVGQSEHFALLCLDLDGAGFDTSNPGDALLQRFGARLRALCPATDLVARTGADEFVVLSNACDRLAAQAAGERLLAALALESGEAPAFVGLSIGIALSPSHGTDLGRLVGEAEIALYQAKYGGGAQCVVAAAIQPYATVIPLQPANRAAAPDRHLNRDAA
jgi:diguanylate cyclase (GGDEF)-like protein